MVQISNGCSNRHETSRVQRRYRARRLEILSAAARAFRKGGFASTGMREIAAAADLSPANLYYYFKGKQELLYFCQERSVAAMLQALHAARSRRATNAEKLHSVIVAHVRCVLDEIQGSAAHLEVDALPPDMLKRLVAKRDRYERGIRRLIAAGIKAGEFVPCDPKLVAQAILGSLNWTARWYRPDGSHTAGQIAGQFAGYLLRGLSIREDHPGSTHARPPE